MESILGNGQKRELPVLFWPKTDAPENNSGRECCWPYLIDQHPLSPIFGQKRPGTPGNSYFAQLPPVFGHFMFLSGGLLDYSNRSTWATRTMYLQPLVSPKRFDIPPPLTGGCSEGLGAFWFFFKRTAKFCPGDREIEVIGRLTTFSHFSVTISGLIPLSVWGILRNFITPARTTTHK